MEQSMDRNALNGQKLDPAVFQRVWSRVMPDDRSSPIAVTPEEPRSPERQPASRPNSNNTVRPQMPQMPPMQQAPQMNQMNQRPGKAQDTTEEGTLRRLMDLAQDGIAADVLLARRGNQTKPLAPIANDHRRAMRQLSACYFLMTGKNYQPGSAAPNRSAAFPQMLREQFQWEQRWTRACMQAAEEVNDPSAKELCRELAGDGMAHTRLIRSILEHQ